MLYQLTHITHYKYQSEVSSCHNMAVLQPRSTVGQNLIDFEITIEPEANDLSGRKDFYGNYQHFFSIQTPHTELKITAKSTIERIVDLTQQDSRIQAAKSVTCGQLPELVENITAENVDAKQFMLKSPLIRTTNPELKKYISTSFAPERPLYDACYEVMHRIYSDFKFSPGITDVTTPVDMVFAARQGVCQDFAHLAIAGLRLMGVPTRYMSGYIETIPPEGEEKLVGADASHAWFAAYIPGFGWFDFDPTNNQIPGDQYITLAWGRDYSDIVPFKGVIYSTGDNTLTVSVDLRQID